MEKDGVSPLGRNIALYRREEQLSAAELADLAGEGLTRSVIANLENGRKDDVTIKQLMALSNALRVPPALLVADLMHSDSPSQYKLPNSRITTFAPHDVSVHEEPAFQDNLNLFRYFSAASFLHDQDRGSTKLASNLLNAISGRAAAWDRFIRLSVRYKALRDGAEPEYPHEELSFDLSVLSAAQELFRWDDVLSGYGANSEYSNPVKAALRSLGLPAEDKEISIYKLENDPFPPIQ